MILKKIFRVWTEKWILTCFYLLLTNYYLPIFRILLKILIIHESWYRVIIWIIITLPWIHSLVYFLVSFHILLLFFLLDSHCCLSFSYQLTMKYILIRCKLLLQLEFSSKTKNIFLYLYTCINMSYLQKLMPHLRWKYSIK